MTRATATVTCLLVAVFSLTNCLWADDLADKEPSTGTIKGQVIDAITKSPVVGANVAIRKLLVRSPGIWRKRPIGYERIRNPIETQL